MELFGAKLEVRDGLPPELMVHLDSLTALAVNAESRVDVGAIVHVEFRESGRVGLTPPRDPFFGSVKRCHGNTPWRSGSRESGRAPAERRGRSGCTELGPPASRPGSRRRPRYHGGGGRSRPDPHSILFGCASHRR